MVKKKIGFKVNPPKVAKLPGYSKSALHTKTASYRKSQAAFDKAKTEQQNVAHRKATFERTKAAQQKVARAKPGVKPIYAP